MEGHFLFGMNLKKLTLFLGKPPRVAEQNGPIIRCMDEIRFLDEREKHFFFPFWHFIIGTSALDDDGFSHVS